MKRRFETVRQAVLRRRESIFAGNNVWLAMAVGLLLIAAAVAVAIWHWDWLRAGGVSIEFKSATSGSETDVTTLRREPNSTTLRNVGLGIAGIIALFFAFWRSYIAERQADTDRRGLFNERYQKGAEMLGSPVLSVRLGGIYALQSLALEQPKQYYLHIMHLLCTFVRHPTPDSTVDKKRAGSDQIASRRFRFREDTQAAMDAIIACRRENIALEERRDDKPNLARADLRGARLLGGNLSSARLDRANLSGARLSNVNLSGASLSRSVLTGAGLEGANLSRAILISADLSGTRLSDANLYRATLERAKLPNARLNRAILSDATLSRATLSGARFAGADLSRTRLDRTDLSNTWLDRANLSSTRLDQANLSGARLSDANLSGARLSRPSGADPANFLTHAQLHEACADPDSPPKLDGVFDADTGEQLVWRGKPCPSE